MNKNNDYTHQYNDPSTRINNEQTNLPPLANSYNNSYTQYNSQPQRNNSFSPLNIIVIAVSVIAIIIALYIFVINPLVSHNKYEKSPEETENTSKNPIESTENEPITISPKSEEQSKPAKTQNTPEAPKQTSETPSNNSAIFAQLESNMVLINGGTFIMGATYEQDEAMDREYPTHEVTLSSFKICKYEVTQELWQAVMGTNPSRNVGTKRPVDNVSWNDCQRFIKKLNSLTGKNYRLPTEAEWEFAARGGNYSQNNKYSGSSYADETAWHSGNSGNTSHNVGQKLPNELGLYDMSGNVFEWCKDVFGDYSYNSQYNPSGPSSGNIHVGRGGGYNLGAKFCRVSGRTPGKSNYKATSLGLRLAHN